MRQISFFLFIMTFCLSLALSVEIDAMFDLNDDDELFARKLERARGFHPVYSGDKASPLHPELIGDKTLVKARQYLPDTTALSVFGKWDVMKLAKNGARLFAFSIVNKISSIESDFFVFCLEKGCQARLDEKGFMGGEFPDEWEIPGFGLGEQKARRALPYAVALRLLQGGVMVYYASPDFLDQPAMFKKGRVLLKQNRKTDLFSVLDRKSLEDPIYGDFLDSSVVIRRLLTESVLENQIDMEFLIPFAREGVFMLRPTPETIHFCEVMVVNLLERPEVEEHQIYNEALDVLGYKTNGYAAGKFFSPRLLNITTFPGY